MVLLPDSLQILMDVNEDGFSLDQQRQMYGQTSLPLSCVRLRGSQWEYWVQISKGSGAVPRKSRGYIHSLLEPLDRCVLYLTFCFKFIFKLDLL